MSIPTHVVFGRGGIRGIAMAGAAAALSGAGYRIERASGISVGGIVAALIASGHSIDEIRSVVWELDYAAMRDRGRLRVPVLGTAWRLVTRLGCYDGDVLQRVLGAVLARKGVRTFGDLRADDPDEGQAYRLQVLCSDVTRGRLVVFPDDAIHYGIDPDCLEVAHALRMSASLPFFFRPVRLGTGAEASLMVDGGLVAGIPYRLFSAARNDRWVTLGVQAGPTPARRPTAVTGLVSLVKAAYYTALAANQENQDPTWTAGTIDIDCGSIAATDFGLSDPQKQRLFDAGVDAANGFITRSLASSGATTLVGTWGERQLSIAGG